MTTKRAEVERLRKSASELREAARTSTAPRDFAAALSRSATVAVIAEVKRRSPGAGTIRADLDPRDQASRYAAGGASAVSVLTDEEYFGGRLADLGAVREAVGMPVLRKDFVIDPIQIHEARGAGADAVLLIVRILSDAELTTLRVLAEELGMTALVEVHDAEELARARDAGARVIGINNRDLTTFETDLAVTLELVDRVPTGAVVVSESGIRGQADVDRMGAAGVDAVLVGEWLVRQPDAAVAAASLSGRPKKARGR